MLDPTPLNLPSIYDTMCELAQASSDRGHLSFQFDTTADVEDALRLDGPRVALRDYITCGKIDPYENRLSLDDTADFLADMGVDLDALKIENIDNDLTERGVWRNNGDAILHDVDSAFSALIREAIERVHGVDPGNESDALTFGDDAEAFADTLTTEIERDAEGGDDDAAALLERLSANPATAYARIIASTCTTIPAAERAHRDADAFEDTAANIADALEADTGALLANVTRATVTVGVCAMFGDVIHPVTETLTVDAFGLTADLTERQVSDRIAARILDTYLTIRADVTRAGLSVTHRP